jgi:hypothetical protein
MVVQIQHRICVSLNGERSFRGLAADYNYIPGLVVIRPGHLKHMEGRAEVCPVEALGGDADAGLLLVLRKRQLTCSTMRTSERKVGMLSV